MRSLASPAILLAIAALSPSAAVAAEPQSLRVCADPNNLPFSNRQRQGFENELADLVARDLHATVRYTWWPQRRGFIRRTLNAGHCDLMVGVPTTLDLLLTTEPYYRSTYVFVYRRDRNLRIRSLDDSALRKLKIGVQLVGDDYANTPPVHALSRRGIVGNLVGYSVFGDYSQPNPPARIIDGVSAGDVDLAIAWGPLAGFFAKRSLVPLEIVPVSPAVDPPTLRFTFDISLAVRPDDENRKRQLEAVLERRKKEIARILADFGVPVIPIS